MTPLEILEYKVHWMNEGGYPVKIHSDLDIKGKDWCRKYLQRTQWSFSPYTDVYEHTFWFEDKKSSNLFTEKFKDWIIE
jgi:hypothetical protein